MSFLSHNIVFLGTNRIVNSFFLLSLPSSLRIKRKTKPCPCLITCSKDPMVSTQGFCSEGLILCCCETSVLNRFPTEDVYIRPPWCHSTTKDVYIHPHSKDICQGPVVQHCLNTFTLVVEERLFLIFEDRWPGYCLGRFCVFNFKIAAMKIQNGRNYHKFGQNYFYSH